MDDKKDILENEGEHDHDHNHDHHHHHDHDEEVSVIYLSFDDEDEEVACEVLGVYEVEDKEYIALAPEDDEGILLYEFQETEEDFDLIPIDDEEELNLVYEAYLALFEEDLEDDDEEEIEED